MGNNMSARDAFEQVDTDGSGQLDFDEIQVAVGQMGHSLDEAKIHKWIKDHDQDGDGQLDFEEFQKLMTELHGTAPKPEPEPESKPPPPPESFLESAEHGAEEAAPSPVAVQVEGAVEGAAGSAADAAGQAVSGDEDTIEVRKALERQHKWVEAERESRAAMEADAGHYCASEWHAHAEAQVERPRREAERDAKTHEERVQGADEPMTQRASRDMASYIEAAVHAVDDAAHAAADATDEAAHAAAARRSRSLDETVDAARRSLDVAVHAITDAAGEAAHATGLDVAAHAVGDTVGAGLDLAGSAAGAVADTAGAAARASADAVGEAAHATGLDIAAHAVADTVGAGLDLAGSAAGAMGSGEVATEETAEAAALAAEQAAEGAALAAEEAAEAAADAAYEMIWGKKKPTNVEADDGDEKLVGKLDAAKARAHFHAGSAFELQGRWIGAEREFRRAARLDPRHPSAAERHTHAEALPVSSLWVSLRAECCRCQCLFDAPRHTCPGSAPQHARARRSIGRPQAQLEGARRAAAADALALSERVAEATSGEPMAQRSARAVLAAHCIDEATVNSRRDRAVGGARALDEAVLLGEVGGAAARVWCPCPLRTWLEP